VAGDEKFIFDAAIDTTSNQEEVYNISIGDTVRRNIFRGINTTIMSYGQKGSGKSYTMFGPEKKKYNRHDISTDDNASVSTIDTTSTYNSVHGTFDEDGVVPRAIHDLFMAKNKQSTGGEVNILMTFVEIYNDGIVDLLTYKKSKGDQLIIRDNIGADGNAGGATIKGVTSIKLKSSSHARHLVNAALKRRASARSHIICTLNVTIKPAVKSSVTSGKLASMTSTDVITAKLTLVDLAGSERSNNDTSSKNHESKKDQKVDGCTAKDMFVFGKCIHALTDKKGKGKTPSKLKHVPFRDCKLTRVLRDSLGGNCCTIMLACVSPCQDDLGDSLSTLRNAESSRDITNHIKKNYVKKISLTAAEGAALRRENKVLKSHVLDMTRKMQRLRRGNAQKPEFVFDIDNDVEDVSGNEATDSKTWRLKYEKLCQLCREANMSIDNTIELTREDMSLLKSHEVEIHELREQISQLMSCHIDDSASITSGLTMDIGDFDDHSAAPSILSLSNLTVKTCEHVEQAKMAEIEDTQKEEKMERMKSKFDEPKNEARKEGDDQGLIYVIEQKQDILKSIHGEIAEMTEIVRKLEDKQQALDKALEEKLQSCDDIDNRRASLTAQVKSLSNEKIVLVEEVEDFQNTADLVAELSAEKETKVGLQAMLDCAVKDADSLRLANLDLQTEFESQRKLYEEESKKREVAESGATMNTSLKEFEEKLKQHKTNQSLAMRVSELEATMKAQEDNTNDTTCYQKQPNDQSRPPLAKKRKDVSSGGDSVVSVSRLLKDYQPKRQKTGDEANSSVLFRDSEDENVRDFNASFDSQSVAFSTGANSLSSDERAIRLHAQKLLFWADKTTGALDDSSALSLSVDKENVHNGGFPTFTTPAKNKPREGLKNASRSHNKSEAPRRSDSWGPKNASPNRCRSQSPGPDASHVSSVQHEKGCSCSGSLFSGNKEHSEFFLPRLGMACNCRGAEKKAVADNEDPIALKSFLRTWQVSFLRSVGIFSADDIVSRYYEYPEETARAMKHWRYSKRMKPARTKACLVALQIWTKTAKTVLRSNKKYLRAIQRSSTPLKYTEPKFLEITAEDNDEVSVMSIMSMDEFPNDALFEGEFEI